MLVSFVGALDMDIVDEINNTWIDEHVNVYPEHLISVVDVDGAHRMDIVYILSANGYKTVTIDGRVVYWRRFTPSEYVDFKRGMLSDLYDKGWDVFHRFRVKSFDRTGMMVYYTEWRIWVNDSSQLEAFLSWLEALGWLH